MGSEPMCPDCGPARRVGLLIETSLSAGRDMLAGVEQFLLTHDSWHIWAQPSDLGQPPPIWFKQWQGDGIIARIQNQAIANQILEKGVPAVDVLGVVRVDDIPLVHVDNRLIAEMAAHHLMEQRLIQFGYFGICNEYWAEERRDGFRECVQEHGFDCEVFEVTRSRLDRTRWEAMVDRVAAWLGKLALPVGIMLCSDVHALLMSEACRVAGLVLGEDIALIGVGNDQPLCNMSHPPLSSVDADHIRVGYLAAELLAAMMDGAPPPDEAVLVKPRGVVVRASTDFLSIDDPALVKAIQYIRDHFSESLQLEDIARHAALSRSVLQRRFRALLGRTVHEEITRNRLRRAIWLIHETDHSIEYIAELSGFGSAQNMARVFRQKFRVSPTRYRATPGAAQSVFKSPDSG